MEEIHNSPESEKTHGVENLKMDDDKFRALFVSLIFIIGLVYVLYELVTYEPEEVKEYKYTLVCSEEIIVEEALGIWASNGGYYSISTREPKNHRNQTYTPEQGQLCEIAKEHI